MKKSNVHGVWVNSHHLCKYLIDWLLNIFHFSIPFIINCISTLIIIITSARTRSNSQKTKSFKEHLHEQIQRHKHLLISPCILIVLAVSQLITSFLSGCMESARVSWFYLIGYCIYVQERIQWINKAYLSTMN
jgi:Na+/H+ antiporter NhaD/arsenite permease-like protein